MSGAGIGDFVAFTVFPVPVPLRILYVCDDVNTPQPRSRPARLDTTHRKEMF